MPDASLYQTIIDAAAAAVTGLALTLNGTALGVEVGKIPQVAESLTGEALPLVAVCPHDLPESVEPFSTEDDVLVKYAVEFAIVAAGNRDYSATNLDGYFRFRERIRRLFQFGCPGVSQVFFAEIRPLSPIDRNELPENFDFSGLGVLFWASEQRTN